MPEIDLFVSKAVVSGITSSALTVQLFRFTRDYVPALISRRIPIYVHNLTFSAPPFVSLGTNFCFHCTSYLAKNNTHRRPADALNAVFPPRNLSAKTIKHESARSCDIIYSTSFPARFSVAANRTARSAWHFRSFRRVPIYIFRHERIPRCVCRRNEIIARRYIMFTRSRARNPTATGRK